MALQHIGTILYGGEAGNALPIVIPDRFKRQIGTHTVRLVWLGLAYHANRDDVAYPTAATLAAGLDIPERKVRCALQVLASTENAYLLRQGTFKVGSHGVPYRLIFPSNDKPEGLDDWKGAEPDDGFRTAFPMQGSTGNRTQACDKDQKEGKQLRRSANRKFSEQELEMFEVFWDLYPRQERRSDALREWWWATRKISPEEIIAALPRFISSVEVVDEEFIPLPSNWLSGGRWEDEL